jgi:O-antigen/teichoic acid export membrane protein
VWLVIGSVLLISTRNSLDYILQAIHRMKTYASIQIVFTLVSITSLILIFIGVFERTYLTVIIVGLFTSAITTVFLCFLLVPGRILLPKKTDQKTLREVFFFSYPIIAGNLAAYVVNWIDVMVIKHYSTMSDVGGYQLAYNVFNLLVGLIGSINVLMTPMLVSFLAAKREDLIVRYSTRLVPQGFFLWTTMIGVGIGICPPIFRIFFGKEFSISATYFQFLALGLVFSSLTNFYSGEITAYKLLKLAMMASVARALVNLIGDFLLVPNIGPIGAAIATTGGVAVGAILYLLICQHRLKERLLWQLTLALPAFLSLGVSHLVSSWESPFLASVVSLAVSYCLAKAFHLFRYEDLALLDYIQMPTSLKKVIAWVYSFLASKAKHISSDVIS